MKKITWTVFGALGVTLLLSGSVSAQGMLGSGAVNSDNHTAREEAEGKIVWEKLQAKQSSCADLSKDDFGVLGEYFMGQMTDASHETMNAMMTQMMGEQGEEQMHVVLGKRLSGCDNSAAFPSQAADFLPMMNMMTGGWSSPLGFNQTSNAMMNFSFMPFGWIFMVLWWALFIAGIIALVKWLAQQSQGVNEPKKSSLEILKQRYARGEIDKKEFEEKKKDLA